MTRKWIATAARAAVLASVLAAAPAFAQTPDKAHLQAARSMMDKSGASRGFESVVPNFLEESKRLFLQTRPELATELDQVSLSLAPEFMKRNEEMLDLIAASYARRFSMAELKEIEAFYSTTAGKKFIQLLPGVMAEVQESSQVWSRKLSEDIVSRMRVEMKKRGHEI